MLTKDKALNEALVSLCRLNLRSARAEEAEKDVVEINGHINEKS